MSTSVRNTDILFNDNTTQGTGAFTGFRNRIINGDMRIDQRNAGASVTVPNTGVTATWSVDRLRVFSTQASRYTVQQNAGAVTPPSGFTNYVGATSSSAYSVLSNDYFLLSQAIEGFNIADLGWGTANAQTVTLSFWVRSSLTGTFGGSLASAASIQFYPFTYSISAANTWQYKTITVPGPTAGTWATNNTTGINVYLSLGAGSSVSGTAGTWAGTSFFSATGATSVVGTNGATLYITGLQLEAGSVATPFERRNYAHELQMCQRYYEVIEYHIVSMNAITGNDCYTFSPFKVNKRATPVVVATDSASLGFPAGSPTVAMFNTGFRANKIANGNFPNGFFAFSATASSEL